MSFSEFQSVLKNKIANIRYVKKDGHSDKQTLKVYWNFNFNCAFFILFDTDFLGI